MSRLLFLLATLLVAPSAFAQPIRATDLFEIRQMDDVAIAPGSRQAIYTIRQAYRDGDAPGDEAGYRTQIWIADLTGRDEPRALTSPSANASQPVWRPDGDAIAFVRSVDGKPQVHVLSLLGGEAVVVTNETSGATSPRFSPDGSRLLYASTRSEADLRRSAGVDLPFRERPRYARSSATPDPDGSLAQIQAYLDSSSADGQARVVDRLDFQGETDLDETMRFRHLFAINADGSGEARLVAGGWRSYGGGAWLVEGDGVVVSAAPGAERDTDLRTHPDRIETSALYVARAGRLTLLAQADSVSFYAPTPAPDGSSVAFLASDLREAGFGQTEIGIVSLEDGEVAGSAFPGGGAARNLTGGFDRSAGGLRWSPSSRYLYFTAASNGGFPLYRVAPFGAFDSPEAIRGDSLATDAILIGAMIRAGVLPDSLAADKPVADGAGEVVDAATMQEGSELAGLIDTLDQTLDQVVADSLARLGPPVERLLDFAQGVRDFDLDQASALFVRTTAANPYELVRMDLSTGEVETVHDPNTWLAGRTVAPMTAARYLTPDSLLVDYWTIRPASSRPRVPTTLEIHGGPSAMWGPGEASMWHEFQLLAARGMGVVFSNPRGSGGYGRAFQRANRMRWGDLPARDVLGALDRAAEEHSWIDESRLGVTGGSYAGYLTAWIVSHDDRFKAAVAQRGVYDLNTFFGEGNAWRLVPTHFGAYPWNEDDSVAYDPLIDADLLMGAERLPLPMATRDAATDLIARLLGDMESLVADLDALPQIQGEANDSLTTSLETDVLLRLARGLQRLPGVSSPLVRVASDTLALDRIPLREVLARNSPLTYADQITTPLLIMHGSDDLRTGVIQSEMLYRTLKVLGRDVEYVRYPGAGHDFEPRWRSATASGPRATHLRIPGASHGVEHITREKRFRPVQPVAARPGS